MTIDDSIFFKGISTAGQIVTSPPFMLSIIIVAFAGIYFQNARLERWSHEVAILRETADGERKFLVKKLRTLHKRLHNEEDSPDSAGMKSSLEVKNDLQELNHMRSQHYNGAQVLLDSVHATRGRMGREVCSGGQLNMCSSVLHRVFRHQVLAQSQRQLLRT